MTYKKGLIITVFIILLSVLIWTSIKIYKNYLIDYILKYTNAKDITGKYNSTRSFLESRTLSQLKALKMSVS